MRNSDSEVKISDYDELNALRKALIGIKFDKQPSVPEVPGSPYIAEISNRIVSACEQHEISSGRASKAQVEAWRDISNHADGAYEIVKVRLRECSKWPDWNDDERLGYLANLIAPFRADSATIQALLNFASHQHGLD